MLAQAFSDVQKAMGVEPQNSTAPLSFSVEHTGRLTFEHGEQEVLVSLAIPLPQYDTETMTKAFRAAGSADENTHPVWVGYFGDSLVLITAVPDHGVNGKQLLHAAKFLITFSTKATQV